MRFKAETVVGFFIFCALIAFFYMTMQIGVFRIDKSKYSPFIAYFKDISGLTKKSDVKIAGVKVGWIEEVTLVDDGKTVRAKIMIPKEYILYQNAQAVVRQEGLLGSKYLEVLPGDPLAPRLPVGGVLSRDSREIATMDDVMQTFKRVANNVEEVSSSLKDALGSGEGAARLKDTFLYFSQAAQKIAAASETLERLIMRNEENIGIIISDVQSVMSDLREKFPRLSESLAAVTEKLNSDFLPSFTKDVHAIAGNFDSITNSFTGAAEDFRTDFRRLSTDLGDFSRQVNRDFLPKITSSIDRVGSSFKNIDEVAQKINDGKGFLGKIVNDETTYNDLKVAVRSLKNSLEKIDRLAVVFDSHVESLQGPVEHRYSFHDAKGYVNLRIHPTEDYFYLAGLTFSQKGYISRNTTHSRFFDDKNNELLPSEIRREGNLFFASRTEIAEEKRDSIKPNIQIGKIFTDLAVRIGLFEGSFGFAVDYAIPMPCDLFRWITTFEAFDIRGRNRLFFDTRPHLKWLNKMFVTPNLYLVFGADDFISRFNKNAFFGAGLRFSDDDIKYIIDKVPLKF